MSFDFANRSGRDQRVKLAIVAVLLLGCGGGCGAKGAGASPDLIPVKGRVFFKGQPLTSGTVRFEPDDFGRPAFGKLQSDGTFVLSTTKDGDGVVAGHHRVSIADTNLNSQSKPKALLKKYAAALTSKFQADVSPEKTEFSFEIE
jgi:hypothetical protein